MLIPTGYYEYSQETVIFYNLDDDKHKAKLTDVAKAMGIEKSEANFINSPDIFPSLSEGYIRIKIPNLL